MHFVVVSVLETTQRILQWHMFLKKSCGAFRGGAPFKNNTTNFVAISVFGKKVAPYFAAIPVLKIMQRSTAAVSV